MNWRRYRCAFVAGLVLLLVGRTSLLAQNISDFFPRVGTTNDVIKVMGSGFNSMGAITVQFSVKKTGVIQNIGNDQNLTVAVPAGAVKGSLGIYYTATHLITNFTAPEFTMIGKGPFVTGLSTNYAGTNQSITIYGVHFTLPVGVRFNGTLATAPTPDAGGSNLVVTVPVGATSGTIVVTNAFGSHTYTNNTGSTNTFTVVPNGPYVVSFSPTNGDSTTPVTINGFHFTGSGTLSVRFNGVAGNIVGTPLDGVITVNPPAGVQTGPISVGRSGVSTNTTTALFYGPPLVTGFSPTNGIAGTIVTLAGQSFLGMSSLQIGGIEVSPQVVATNNTNVIVAVPPGGQSGVIRVVTPAGVQFSGKAFRILPTLTSFSPAIGRPGTNITIFGANLNEGLSSVKINGTNAIIVGLPAYGQVTVTVSNGTTTGPITVTTTNGTVSSVTNFFLPPQITGFTPTNSGPGSTVTITGQNLLGVSAVNFTGVSTNIPPQAPPSNTVLQVTVPTNVITGPISVTAPAGTTNSGTLLFYGTPVINSFTPTNGVPGATIAIFGTNFMGASAVRFNGVLASSTNVDNGRINAVVPGGALNGPITVTAPGGIATSAAPFMVSFTSDLAVSIAASPGLVFVGSNLTYTIVVTNRGPSDASGAVLTNLLPPSVNLVGASTTLGTLNTNLNPITGAFGTLINSSSATVTLTVVPQLPGTIVNTATIASSYTDPVVANNSASLSTIVYPLPVLSIQIYSPSQVQIGWPLALTNFDLQYNRFLSASSEWSNILSVPLPSGTQQVIIDPIDATPKFYRLKH